MDEDGGAIDNTCKWDRPPAAPLTPARESLIFQQIELDSYVGNPMPGMPGTLSSTVNVSEYPQITLFVFQVLEVNRCKLFECLV